MNAEKMSSDMAKVVKTMEDLSEQQKIINKALEAIQGLVAPQKKPAGFTGCDKQISRIFGNS
jgi:hypothetical protein